MSTELKITFIIPAPFGTRGTAGTYLFIDAFSQFCDVQVITPFREDQAELRVFTNGDIPLVEVRYADMNLTLMQIHQAMKKFSPNIAYMFNAEYNLNIISKLKSHFKMTKWVLDYQTPLLVEGQIRRRRRTKSFYLQFFVDKIFTLRRDSVKSWTPFLFRKPIVYPLGLKLDYFFPKKIGATKIRCKKFVFIGTLAKIRKVSFLIQAMKQLSCMVDIDLISLDIYGDGDDRKELELLVRRLKLEKTIRLCGLKPQKELNRLLSTYDAGIAYVPNEKYEKSPSLKSIEFAAAGLPVIASDTLGHRDYLKYGLHFYFFRNNPEDFCNLMKNAITKGMSAELIESNIDHVKNFDYSKIIEKYIYPELVTLPKKVSV